MQTQLLMRILVLKCGARKQMEWIYSTEDSLHPRQIWDFSTVIDGEHLVIITENAQPLLSSVPETETRGLVSSLIVANALLWLLCEFCSFFLSLVGEIGEDRLCILDHWLLSLLLLHGKTILNTVEHLRKY